MEHFERVTWQGGILSASSAVLRRKWRRHLTQPRNDLYSGLAVTAVRHSRLTEGDENVSRYGIKEALVSGDAVLIPRAMAPRAPSPRGKVLEENTAIVQERIVKLLFPRRWLRRKIPPASVISHFLHRASLNLNGKVFHRFPSIQLDFPLIMLMRRRPLSFDRFKNSTANRSPALDSVAKNESGLRF